IQHSEWACASCSEKTMIPTWLGIDLVERPDLRPSLSDGSYATFPCPQCGRAIARSQPLLVTRLGAAAPVLVGLPVVAMASGLPEGFQPVLDRARGQLGDAVREIPGPLILVSFEVLAIAAARDVDADY